jgi:hypothetical protein
MALSIEDPEADRLARVEPIDHFFSADTFASTARRIALLAARTCAE